MNFFPTVNVYYQLTLISHYNPPPPLFFFFLFEARSRGFMCVREEGGIYRVPFNKHILPTHKSGLSAKEKQLKQHFTHFLPLQSAMYLSEAKEDGSNHPVNDTCSWTVAGPTSPPQPSHSILIPGQPVPALDLMILGVLEVSPGVPISKSLV